MTTEKMQWLIDNQQKWAKEYKEQEAKYKLEKNRAEKARAKELKYLKEREAMHHK